jgi:toxin CptA
MSIALTVTLHPSRKLHILAISFSLLILIVGIWVSCTGNVSIFWRLCIALVCFGMSIVNFIHVQSANQKNWHITISEQGEFQCQPFFYATKQGKSSTMRPYLLASGTTLWSDVLFLRLKAQDSDTVISLMIFSDALNKDEFRRISIACRWLIQQSK